MNVSAIRPFLHFQCPARRAWHVHPRIQSNVVCRPLLLPLLQGFDASKTLVIDTADIGVVHTLVSQGPSQCQPAIPTNTLFLPTVNGKLTSWQLGQQAVSGLAISFDPRQALASGYSSKACLMLVQAFPLAHWSWNWLGTTVMLLSLPICHI